jgi:hypothetical protein
VYPGTRKWNGEWRWNNAKPATSQPMFLSGPQQARLAPTQPNTPTPRTSRLTTRCVSPPQIMHCATPLACRCWWRYRDRSMRFPILSEGIEGYESQSRLNLTRSILAFRLNRRRWSYPTRQIASSSKTLIHGIFHISWCILVSMWALNRLIVRFPASHFQDLFSLFRDACSLQSYLISTWWYFLD